MDDEKFVKVLGTGSFLPGNPILFDAATFPAIEAISGDEGARSLIDEFGSKKIEWDESALIDVDTPEDLKRLS